MKYKLPDLKDEYFRIFKERFLALNNLKVGDVVVIPFNYHIIRSSYKGKPERYNNTKECEAILKEDNNGALIAESIEKLDFYNNTNNGLTGRGRKEWYKKEMKPALYKFGSGFMH